VKASDCAVVQDLDCNGDDIMKISNTTKIMTADLCCQLCESHASCTVAVFVPNWENLALCELKNGCNAQSMRDRVRLCPPKSKNLSYCASPAPTPAPGTCDSTKLPVFCDPAKSIDERTAEIVSTLTVDEKVAQVTLFASLHVWLIALTGRLDQMAHLLLIDLASQSFSGGARFVDCQVDLFH
jgi:hypothetical protein